MNVATLAEDHAAPESAPETDEGERAEPTKPVTAADRRIRIRRQVLRGVVFFVVLVLAGLALEGPIGRVWYESRQRNLAADLNAKRPGTAKGQALAVLQIPKIGLNLVVVEGDGPSESRGGPGHRRGTPLPGDVGNSVILGHRSGWGGPFAKLAQVQLKDSIVLKKRTDAQPFRFQVVSVVKVGAGDVRPLAKSTDHRVTLVTSGRGQFAGDRVIVTAVAGDQGKLLPPTGGLPANSRHGSVVFNATTLLFVLLVGVLALAVQVVGRRHRAATVAAVVMPVALAALLALLLELDLAILPAVH